MTRLVRSMLQCIRLCFWLYTSFLVGVGEGLVGLLQTLNKRHNLFSANICHQGLLARAISAFNTPQGAFQMASMVQWMFFFTYVILSSDIEYP